MTEPKHLTEAQLAKIIQGLAGAVEAANGIICGAVQRGGVDLDQLFTYFDYLHGAQITAHGEADRTIEGFVSELHEEMEIYL